MPWWSMVGIYFSIFSWNEHDHARRLLAFDITWGLLKELDNGDLPCSSRPPIAETSREQLFAWDDDLTCQTAALSIYYGLGHHHPVPPYEQWRLSSSMTQNPGVQNLAA